MKRLTALLLAVIMITGIAAVSADTLIWTCAACGNAGNFGPACSACGAARDAAPTAAADTWTCVCGTAGLTSKFCPECGTPRPAEPEAWTCLVCGTKDLTGKFCPNCGTPNGTAPTAEPFAKVTAEPTAEPTAAPAAVNVKVGDYVFFGKFEQNNNNTSREPIEWRVLDVQDGAVLLLSRYALYNLPVNKTSNGSSWEKAYARTWLNNTFLKSFTDDELAKIRVTCVSEKRSQQCPDFASKRVSSDTNDRVFLLSYSEVVKYLPEASDRMCVATRYVKNGQKCQNESRSQLLDGQKTSWWWLRTPAYKNNFLVVDWDGSFQTCYMHHAAGVLRPAMWVDASAF